MTSFRKFLLGAGLALATTAGLPAIADDHKGFYVSVGAGATKIQDTGIDATLGGTGYYGTFDYDQAYSGEYGFGYNFGNNFRTEASFYHFSGALAGHNLGGSKTVEGTGDLWVQGWMLSAYYDIDTGSKVTPYFGGGFGPATITTEDGTLSGNTVNGKDYQVLGYQIKAGASLEMSSTIDVFGEFIYNGTEDVDGDVDYDPLHAFGGRGGIRYNF